MYLKKKQNETIGQYLKRLRINRNYSQRKVASVTEMSYSIISLYESDKNIPSAENCIELAKLYKIDILYLLHICGHISDSTLITNRMNLVKEFITSNTHDSKQIVETILKDSSFKGASYDKVLDMNSELLQIVLELFPDEIKELVKSVKHLSPRQINKISEMLKTMK